MSDLVGRTLGPYEIIEEIGRGGMAIVYKAYQPSMERTAAIKVLPRQFLHDPTFLTRFKREVRAIAHLEHPRILPVYEAGEVDGVPYFAMRYVEGGSLTRRIGWGPLGLDESARLVAQIAEGLDYAHRKGVIHRDFKPSNVLIDQEGNAYLADFGIAKVSEMTMQLTGSMIIGTPAYMAPEMSEPGGSSTLVDVYALGVTLYQMLTGSLPYEADTPMGLLMAHVTQPIPDAREVQPDLPDAVQTVIERALAKDPADRYQTAGALAADLQRVTTRLGPTPVEAAEGVPIVEEVEPIVPAEEPTPPAKPTPPAEPPFAVPMPEVVEAPVASVDKAASAPARPAGAETSTLAIVSLIASIAGLVIFPLVGSVAGVIIGNMAKKEIARSGGAKTGNELARAGVIVGWIGLGLLAFGLIFGVLLPLGCALLSG